MKTSQLAISVGAVVCLYLTTIALFYSQVDIVVDATPNPAMPPIFNAKDLFATDKSAFDTANEQG